MSSQELLIDTALRFLRELNQGEMDCAVQDGFLLLKLMKGNTTKSDATKMVLPTPPPRKADKYQVAPFIR
jgi:hypothetical protein